MVGVFLVEDEYVVREGVKKSIDWHGNGMEFLGEATDGELAFPQICKCKPDILITDIRMPFMDGLELSRLVRKELPDTKILILSGYGDFNYAKKAIELGITNYLLKPITPDKLLEAVSDVADIVRKDREKEENLQKFQKEMKENEDLARTRFFNELVSRTLNFEQIMQETKERGLDFSASFYKIILFTVTEDREDTEMTAYQDNVVRFDEKIAQFLQDEPGIDMFARGVEGLAFLIKGESAEQIDELSEKLLTYAVSAAQECGSLCYFGACGNLVQRVKEISESFMLARRVFSYRYLGRKNCIVNYEEANAADVTPEQVPDIRNIDLGRMDRDIVKNFLKNGVVSETETFLSDYLNRLGDQNLDSLILRQYIAMDVYISTTAFLSKLGYDDHVIMEKLGDVRQLCARIESARQMREYLAAFLTAAVELRDSSATKRLSKLLDDARAYIEAHYADEDISLNQVAESVNISPNYFSTIFSQETDSTFIEYLTRLRMSKAMELLRCTDRKTSDIADSVGYRDAHYFSYLFRKLNGCSPREYREKT